jgi:hypothetical protein
MSTPIQVSTSLDWLGRMVSRHPRLWIRLGNLESRVLADSLKEIHAPVYVCGLARAGSTKLLEILAAQPNTASHRYRDFPFVFTPYWWNKTLSLSPLRDKEVRERAHGDGIMINADSPEAMEEILWMAFFAHLHASDHTQVLDETTNSPAFEQFYRRHIGKLLLANKRTRYICKGNYHVTRMAYLLKLFPDARFIIPIREPVSHVVSLMRQHQRFSQAGQENPRITAHMSMVGHFEFGLNRIPINTGDEERMQEILAAWRTGDEVRGWALYWDAIYRFIHRQLQTHPILERQSMIVSFEQLYGHPYDTINQVLQHAHLPVDDAMSRRQASGIRKPSYPLPLNAEEIALIKELTGPTARLFGYSL